MLSVSSTTRIFVHALPTDMRKSFDGLYALVVHSFGKDIFQGDYFVFVNRTRDRCKVLFWTATVWWSGPSGSNREASSCRAALSTAR
jgi:transposase